MKEIGAARDFKNIGYSLIEFLVNPLLTIMATPLLLKLLGAELYGSWVLMVSLVAILSVTNLGVSNAVVKYGSAYLERSDLASFNRVLRFTMALCLLIGSLTTLALFLLGPHLLFLFQNASAETGGQIVTAARILGAVVGVKIVTSVYSAVCMAHHRYDVLNKTNMLVNVGTTVCSVVLIYAGMKLVGLVVLMLVMSVIAAAFQYSFGRRLNRGLNFWPKWDREAARTVFGYGIYSWLQVISSVIYTQADRIIISSILGPAALGVYSVCMQLASKLHEIPGAAGAFLFPKFSSLRETAQTERLRSVYAIANKVVVLAVTSLSVPMFLYAESILSVWIDPDFSRDAAPILRLLIIGVASGTIGIVPFYFLNGTEYVKLNTKINFAQSGLTLLGTLGLVPFAGLAGTAFSRMLGLPIGIAVRWFIELRLLGIGWKLLFTTLAPALLLFALSGGWIAWIGGPQVGGLASLLFQLGIAALGVLLLMGLILFGGGMSAKLRNLRNREREETV
ncbi:Membrane protein involved in the export of O-antigen and teichoic acid [Paenibacillus tianmuensis]|uniref:Membrane protein involved in the export of O-antigen and teichoic acid n=1 Tax=Paenibacillus tianmuensis TaxID=624147 RepID=A0A1G4R5U1_9BACL|nr:oligosaccharide flippase family protein [Paenibacillus tianmuensis]SCW52192.1 Membrane protein involved in the export of O-antigen and teichoic acid [Paenibacillus tianmuensis]